MITNFTLYILFSFVFLHKCDAEEKKTVGDTLFNDLFLTYKKDLLPQKEVNRPVTVNVTFLLMGIRELDEKTGKLSVMSSLMLTWNDFRLKWNPSSYGNQTLIVIPEEIIWKPNPTLLNPYDNLKLVADGLFPVTIVSEGLLYWPIGGIMSSVCNVDVTYYPFDIQVCTLKFTPWGYPFTSVQLLIGTPEIIRYHFTEDGEWDIISTNIRMFHAHISMITVELVLQRRPAFVIYNFILPVVILLTLNCLVFVLPVESGERVSYSVTVLLAVALFLTLVENNLPKTSLPTAMLTYFLLSYVIISAAICALVVFNSSLYFKDDKLHPVPIYLVQMMHYCFKKKVLASDTNSNESPKSTIRASVGSGITWRTVSQWIDKILFRVCLLVVAVSTTVLFLVLKNGK